MAYSVLTDRNCYLFVSADNSEDKSREEKKDNSAKIRFAGGRQSLGDDQSKCADDIARLCPDIPKGNNFALLVCLQEKAKVHFVCRATVRDGKLR